MPEIKYERMIDIMDYEVSLYGMGGQKSTGKFGGKWNSLGKKKNCELTFISLHKKLCKLKNVKEFMWAIFI